MSRLDNGPRRSWRGEVWQGRSLVYGRLFWNRYDAEKWLAHRMRRKVEGRGTWTEIKLHYPDGEVAAISINGDMLTALA